MRKDILLCTLVLFLSVILNACKSESENEINSKSNDSGHVVVNTDYLLSGQKQSGYTTKDNFNFDQNGYIVSADVEGDITLPDNTVGIAKESFKNNNAITSLTSDLPLDICSGSFENAGLKSLELTSNSTVIQDLAFANCKKLEHIKINGSIGVGAFKGCSALKSIEIMEGVTTIFDNTFEGCSQVNVITLPSSIVNCTKNSFKNCKILKVRGYNNTFAQWFAEEVGATFESLGNIE